MREGKRVRGQEITYAESIFEGLNVTLNADEMDLVALEVTNDLMNVLA